MIPGLAEHIKHHRALRLYGATAETLTVGAGQRFSTTEDALAVASAKDEITDVVTAACSSVESNAAGTLDKRLLTADSGTPFSVFSLGTVVGVKIGASTCPVLGVVYTSSKILLRHPLLSDVAAASCDVGLPNYTGILLMPGHTESLTAALSVPSFTTIAGLVRGTAKLEATNGQAIFTVPVSSNETLFNNLILQSVNTGGVRLITYPGLDYQADTYIDGIDGFSAAQDGFYFSDGALGGVHVSNCNITSGYDTMRLRAHREVNISNNVFDAFSVLGTTYGQAAAIALGTASLTPMPVENYNIRGNTLKAFGQDIVTGSVIHGDVRTIDVRNTLNTGANLLVVNNNIYATGDVDTPGTGEVVGLKCLGSAAGEAPTILSVGNTFDVRNDGTGDAFSMDSDQANYDILRENNVQLSGCTLGANTTVATTV